MQTKFVLAMVAGVIAGTGCKKVVKNTNAKTPPAVEIKVRGSDGQYAVASEASLAAGAPGQLELLCIVHDNEGVKSISLSFSSQVDACNVGGAIYTGVFSLATVPAPQFQGLSGDASGQVLEQVPLMATVTGPFSCTVPGNGTGTPYGTEIVATCDGHNWAADPSKAKGTAKLTIKLK